MNPTKEFRDYLISQGAALVGIGDLTAVPSSDYPVGIAVAIPLPKHVIKGLQLAPTREYYELYNSLSDKLNTIVTAGAKYLTDTGMAGTALGVCDRGIAGQRGIGQKRRKPYGRTILWCYQPVVFTDPAKTGSGGNRLM